MMYEFEIEGVPFSWNKFINRTHWTYYGYAQAIKKQMLVAAIPLRDEKWPLSNVWVWVHLGYRTKRKSDLDSLCLKPHVDALVMAGIITDDNKNILKQWGPTSWEYSDTPFTRVIIEEM